MCDDQACDSELVPPAGEKWCWRRLDLELWRWLTGYPMTCGPELDLHPRR